MSKFNSTKSGRWSGAANTVNRAGGAAYTISDNNKEIASVILASMLSGDSSYQSEKSRQEQIFKLVAGAKDKEFVAKAMVFARHEGNLRSISHLLANALVENARGESYIRRAIRKAIFRPDDMTEMAALWFTRHSETMIPNSMRRAFKDSLESGRWDAYQLRKYAGTRSAVKLKDIVKLAHPRDTKGLFRDLINDTLAVADTVETRLSSGQEASAAFTDLLAENRLGYMVALKNVVKAVDGMSDEVFKKLVSLFINEKAVKKSKVLPFRFVQAWDAVKQSNMDTFRKKVLYDAFNTAMKYSIANSNLFREGERVAVIMDQSGSMGCKGSESAWAKGIPLAAAAAYSSNAVFYLFDSKCVELDTSKFNGPLGIIDSLRPNGGATYFHAPLQKMIEEYVIVDKIILFSDMQLYGGWGDTGRFDGVWSRYKRIAPKAKLLFWNLEGYGDTPLDTSRQDITLVSGYSDTLLSIISKIFDDPDYLVKTIKNVEI